MTCRRVQRGHVIAEILALRFISAKAVGSTEQISNSVFLGTTVL